VLSARSGIGAAFPRLYLKMGSATPMKTARMVLLFL
jgi:hypothetical protein